MANLNSAITQLDTAFKTLRQRWESTSAVWNDPVSRSFAQDYWAPLEEQVQATGREMDRLAQVIAQARRGVK
jgi:hypothetical protein